MHRDSEMNLSNLKMKKIKRPTPETDAFREVVFAQYKEDELTGDGMGNILAALTDIETLERERDEANKELHKQIVLFDQLFAEAEKIRIERDEAQEALMKIEEVFIDSDDTYEALRKMGNIARAALESKI